MTSLTIALVLTTLVFLALPPTRPLGAAGAIARCSLYPVQCAALLVVGPAAVAFFNRYRR